MPRATKRGAQAGHPESGMALIMAMFFVAMAVVVLAALTSRLIGEGRGVLHFKSFENCAYGIDSATAQSLASLEALGDGMVGIVAATAPKGKGGADVPLFTSAGVTPQVLSELPTLKYMAYCRNWGSDGLDNNGNSAVDEAAEKLYYSIYATAQDGATKRKSETIVKAIDIKLWQNAVSVGNGLLKQGAIIGNMNINGGVLVVGSNLASTDGAIALSGGASITNGYALIPADVLTRIPSIPTTVFGSETVQTLSASVRVKNGTVAASSPSKIGAGNVLANLTKETVDGAYLSGGLLNPENLYSDNGTTEGWDLRDRVTVPQLDMSDFCDTVSGTQAGVTHATYFRKLAGTPYPGNVAIAFGTPFYYNATRPSDTDPTRRLKTDNYIYYKTSGIVDLSFANNSAICAYGTGKIVLGGNSTINGNIQLAAGSSGFLDMNRNSHVTGSIITDGKGTFTPDKTSTIDGGVKITDVSNTAVGAEKAIASINALTPTQILKTINTTTTIKSTGAVNVISIVGDLDLNGKEVLTLDGNKDDIFIIRVTGKIVTNGSAVIQSTQGQSNKVLFNSVDKMSINGAATIGTFITSAAMDIGNQKYNSNFIFGSSSLTTMGNSNVGGTIFDGGGGSGNLVEVNGEVEINGSLSFSGGAMNYTGRSTIFVHGDVTLGTDLLPVNADGSALKSFPEANCLALMTLQNMSIAPTSAVTVIGAFYAEGQIATTQGATVVGGLMANSVAAGKVVPSIFAVPTLADNLPEGMIGGCSVRVMKPISYREVQP